MLFNVLKPLHKKVVALPISRYNCRVQSTRYRLQGTEVQGTDYRVQGTEVQGTEVQRYYRVQGTEVQGTGYRVQGTEVQGTVVLQCTGYMGTRYKGTYSSYCTVIRSLYKLHLYCVLTVAWKF